MIGTRSVHLAASSAGQRGLLLALIVVAFAVLLTGCATQPEPSTSDPGFFKGLFHGFAAPVTLFLGWLWEGRIYAFPNDGWWYDLGFLLGMSTWGGGAAASRAKR